MLSLLKLILSTSVSFGLYRNPRGYWLQPHPSVKQVVLTIDHPSPMHMYVESCGRSWTSDTSTNKK